MRRSTLRKSNATDEQSRDIGRHAGSTRPYDPFDDAQIETLIEATKAYLQDIGIRFEPDTEADDVFATAGCRVRDDGVVHITRSACLTGSTPICEFGCVHPPARPCPP